MGSGQKDVEPSKCFPFPCLQRTVGHTAPLGGPFLALYIVIISHFNLEIIFSFFFQQRNFSFFFLFETKFHQIAQAGLKLPISLSLPPSAGVVCATTSSKRKLFTTQKFILPQSHCPVIVQRRLLKKQRVKHSVSTRLQNKANKPDRPNTAHVFPLKTLSQPFAGQRIQRREPCWLQKLLSWRRKETGILLLTISKAKTQITPQHCTLLPVLTEILFPM